MKHRKLITHRMPIDKDTDIFIRLPRDLNKKEAERLTKFLKSLAVEENERQNQLLLEYHSDSEK